AAGRAEGYHTGVGGSDPRAPADGEALAGRVDDGGSAAMRAEVGEAVRIRHRLDPLRRLIAVTRLQHDRTRNRAEARDVFQRHAGWTRLSRREPGMRSAQ